ncbi:hypothetical protein POTOM_033331 [Populus tomentosa]|uniref:UBC core domain-containing protein n=1 Tax=Populus tomentosa TaxID=118781 RepID=A0A8X7Z1U6_POPTO|nr:hypothetical protein POTOM_033331 [Populus tomentosa]
MIKLFKVKEKQRELAENANGKSPIKKQSAGELRLHKDLYFDELSDAFKCFNWVEEKVLIFSLLWLVNGLSFMNSIAETRIRYLGVSLIDISELNLHKTCTMAFPNGKDDLMNFEVTIRPDEGYYRGGTFVFSFQISSIYPHEAPKVKCKTKVYHPNIDLEGNVCLNILREDWKPVLNINTIIYGLFHLFTEPNHEDPLNQDAAAVLRDNPQLFESNVRRAMAGGYMGQTFFPRCI